MEQVVKEASIRLGAPGSRPQRLSTPLQKAHGDFQLSSSGDGFAAHGVFN